MLTKVRKAVCRTIIDYSENILDSLILSLTVAIALLFAACLFALLDTRASVEIMTSEPFTTTFAGEVTALQEQILKELHRWHRLLNERKMLQKRAFNSVKGALSKVDELLDLRAYTGQQSNQARDALQERVDSPY